MKMKLSIISALLVLGTTACVDSSPSLQVGAASAQGADCSVSSDGPGLLRGSVDLSLRSGGFPLVLAVTSNLGTQEVKVGDQSVIGGTNLNTIYVTSMDLSFSTPTPGLKFSKPQANIPLYGTVVTEGTLLVNLFTTDVIQDVNNFVGGGSGAAEVIVTLKLKGQRASGDGLDSNEIVFPVMVYESGFTCPAGTQLVPSDDPCPQAGLNGVLPKCEEATP